MERVFKKLLFVSHLLFVLLGVVPFGYSFGGLFGDLEEVKGRVERNLLLSDHLKSFTRLEELLQVYFTSYKSALQESLVAQPRWIDELKRSRVLLEASPRLKVRGTAAGGYLLHSTKEDVSFYIDRGGAFHLVRFFDRGRVYADIVIGFDPFNDALSSMRRNPRWVALYDKKNNTLAKVFQRGRGQVEMGEPGKGGDSVQIRFRGMGKVILSKPLNLDGKEMFLISQYVFLPVERWFLLLGLFIILVLAILVFVGAGASFIGGTAKERLYMKGKSGDEDIINEIDREVSGEALGGVSGTASAKKEKESILKTPVSEGEALRDAVEDIEEALVEKKRAEQGVQVQSPQKVLQQDGIIIKKS